MDTVWIKRRMRALKVRQKTIAKEIGITVGGLSKKLRNQSPVSLKEACIIARHLRLTRDEIVERLLQMEVRP